jgi:hypothetical protein
VRAALHRRPARLPAVRPGHRKRAPENASGARPVPRPDRVTSDPG